MNVFSSGDHESAKRIDQRGEWIDLREETQSAWHDVQRINRIACEKHGHGQQLSDAHETLACFYDARDDERESGKYPRAQYHTSQHSEDRQRIQPE